MWIVIEGVEGTGKTTVAHRLEALGWRYEHATTADTLDKLYERMLKLSKEHDVVWDRAHLSEVVYGWVRREQRVNREHLILIEARLASMSSNCYLLQGVVDNDHDIDPVIESAFKIARLESNLAWLDRTQLERFIRQEVLGPQARGDREGGS